MVFDDSVVNQSHLLLAVCVRMGISFAGLSMGGPASMPDAGRTVDWIEFEQIFQFFDLALLFSDFQLAFINSGDARRIIPAIFQSGKTYQKHRVH